MQPYDECYANGWVFSYFKEETGQHVSSSHLVVLNVTAHPLTVSVPTQYYLVTCVRQLQVFVCEIQKK